MAATRGPNRKAVEALLSKLKKSDALVASAPLVELLRTLADDMDSGEEVSCPKCKTPFPVGHNAALVKQYRELVAQVDADGGGPSIEKMLASLRDSSPA